MAHPESFDHMLAAWNETNPAEVRKHLDKALAADVQFIDPSIETNGIDEFEANVHDVHARIPGAHYSRTSGIDGHHHLYRYSWQISRDDEVVLPGFDVVELDEDEKVARVLGFFGPLPGDE